MSDVLTRLQQWYFANCDGDWEHTYGVHIENIDNPGWLLAVQLTHTYLEAVAFSEVKVQRASENDWLQCRVEDREFKGACGPLNLEELLSVFLKWADENIGSAG
ncbi:MAG: immunity 53 family protein [Pseudomonadota bacterium]